MSAYTVAIVCPSCGGNAFLAEGSQVVHCLFCDRKSLAGSPLGYPVLYLPPQITQEDAKTIAEKYVPPELAEVDVQNPPPPPIFHQAQLLLIPFWRVQARMIGWVSGQAPFKTEVIEEWVENADGRGYMRKKNLVSGGEPLKKMLVHIQQYTYPAAEVQELGVLRLHWNEESLEFKPFKPESTKPHHYIITPTVSAAKIQREAQTLFMKRVLNPYREYTDFFHRLKLLRTQLTLFYYPLWVVKGEQGGNFSRRVIDAHDGKILAADELLTPPRQRIEAVELLGAAGLAGLFAGTLLKEGLPGVVLVLALGGLVYLGYRWIRKLEL